jgi:hypothetical protein
MRRAKRDPNAVREAAITACASLLFNSGLDQRHPADLFILKRMLDHLVWYFSETHDTPGKYLGCPWWSEAALQLYENGRGWQKEVALDHVVEREKLVTELLCARTNDDLRSVLARSQTCVVLRHEHSKLSHGSGWERYAKIKVVPGPRVPRG